jgi:glycosyltransferase involved in cell wall biosynthesis
MDNLAGSFYCAVVNNAMENGMWEKSIHYTHGFRVGGILAAGYCEYLNSISIDRNIEKILFCARDCDVIYRIYNKFYNDIDSNYVAISRYAITGIAIDRYYFDYIGRSFFRCFDSFKHTKTLEQVFTDTGFGYLVEYLEEADIEKYLFPSSIRKSKLEDFFYKYKNIVEDHNQESIKAAKKYFAHVIGESKRLLIVDIGWSGTCLIALRDFLKKEFPENDLEIFGALMCTSRKKSLVRSMSSGMIDSYVSSPFANLDITRFMMPEDRRYSVLETDLLHLPLEYLFTQAEATLLKYQLDSDENVELVRGNNHPPNTEEIIDMQAGIFDFVEQYLDYSRNYSKFRKISAYVAFNPLKNAIGHKEYIKKVYKNYLYDAVPMLLAEPSDFELFGSLFSSCFSDNETCANESANDRESDISACPQIGSKITQPCLSELPFSYPYVCAKSRRHRFIQMGTIEYRNGLDLCVAAYKSMPREYRDKSELFFAGGFTCSGVAFASYVFSEIQDEKNIHYLGTMKGQGKWKKVLSQTDTVIVASREESNKSVAFEEAIFSKPLIVSEKDSVKNFVDDQNGFIVESGSTKALRDVFMDMIDKDDITLKTMGAHSREIYDGYVGEKNYLSEPSAPVCGTIKEVLTNSSSESDRTIKIGKTKTKTYNHLKGDASELVVSLTSYPLRISTVAQCIESLLFQTIQPKNIFLWLSSDQFPKKEGDLPSDLLALVGRSFEIRWCNDDLGPHKKYFHIMQECPDSSVVTVDDDVVYEQSLIETLYQTHLEKPSAVICNRANLILFKPNGELREYDNWVYDCQFQRGNLTYQLLPTGVGGILYPPHAVPSVAFNISAIMENCRLNDDLWLKVMTTANGYPVLMPTQRIDQNQIDGTQDVALYRTNRLLEGNATAFQKILDYYSKNIADVDSLLQRIRSIESTGEFIGPNEVEKTTLLGSLAPLQEHHF